MLMRGSHGRQQDDRVRGADLLHLVHGFHGQLSSSLCLLQRGTQSHIWSAAAGAVRRPGVTACEQGADLNSHLGIGRLLHIHLQLHFMGLLQHRHHSHKEVEPCVTFT